MHRETTVLHASKAFRATRPSLKAGVLFLAAAVLAAVVPLLSNPLLLALVVGLLGLWLAPMWIDYQNGRLDPIESIHVMGLRYFAFFGLGALWTYQSPGDVAFDKYIPPYLLQATFYCVLGYLALLAGYYGPWRHEAPGRRFEERPAGLWFVLLPGLIGFAGSMAAAIWSRAAWAGVNLSAMISSIAQLAPLWDFAWALCWLVALHRATRPLQRWLLLGLFVPASLMILGSNLADKSLALTVVAVPICALWYARGKLPRKTLGVLALVSVFVIFPFFNTFRLFDARIDTAARIVMTARVISHWDAEQYMRASLVSVERRLALVNSVAVVIRDTGRWVPYAEGDTLFLPLLAFFVPRVLWPDKPSFSLGREFADTFRVVHILDDQTSIAATVPGELYWNFDLPGVLIGMALWGMALRFFYRRYGAGSGFDPVRRATHIVVLIQFVHFGGGLAAQSVMMLRTLILIEAFRWIARRAGLLRVEPAGSV